MKIETQEDFWIEISKCNFNSDQILSVLMYIVASMLPTKDQVEKRRISQEENMKEYERIRKKSKAFRKEIKQQTEEIKKL